MKTIEKILAMIKITPGITVAQIMEQTNLSRQIIHRYLKKLRQDNLITKKGKSPQVFYFFENKKNCIN